jgi:hypothetical protein
MYKQYKQLRFDLMSDLAKKRKINLINDDFEDFDEDEYNTQSKMFKHIIQTQKKLAETMIKIHSKNETNSKITSFLLTNVISVTKQIEEIQEALNIKSDDDENQKRFDELKKLHDEISAGLNNAE